MAAREFHVNLTNSSFPHNFDELGSTVIYATPFEQNRAISGGFSGQDAEQSAGVCQAYFMQNILPTSRGYSSVSFLETLPPIPGMRGVPEDTYILRGESSASAVFVPTTDRQYIFDPTVGSWQEFSVGTLAPSPPTVAFVKQRSFVFYPNIGCFEYDFTAQEFREVTFEGLNVGNIHGICPAGSVLVAWDSTTVYWSSVLDPLDFTPSLSTGAGSTSILAVRGEIITCLSMGENFVVYTATNAVGARQSGNIQLPFTFTEISGSEGIESAQHVAYDTNQGVHITWTASGFQQVSLEQAGYVWPEFSDGIIRAIYSDYDENFNRPVLRRVERLELKLNFIGNRWVGISVKDAADASGSYNFAMIYDTSLQRWGRLDVLHKDLVEFVGPNISRSLTYAELAEEYPTYADMVNIPYQQFAEQVVISSPRSGLNFGVALSNGSIYRAALYQTELGAETTNGIVAAPPRIILGKFKIFRTQGAMLHGFKAQRLEDGVGIRAHLHSYTGGLVGHKVGFVGNNKHAGHFLGRANADSFSLEFTGKFHLTDLVCNAANAGSRNQRGVALLEEVLCLQTGDGECVKVTQDGIEYCVVVGGDPSKVGNVGSKLELQALYDYGLTLEEDKYSEETWQVFAASMLEALEVLETPGTTQAVIDGAYAELEAGIAQLVSKHDYLITHTSSFNLKGAGRINSSLASLALYPHRNDGNNGNYLDVSSDTQFFVVGETVTNGDARVCRVDTGESLAHFSSVADLRRFRGISFDKLDPRILYVFRDTNVTLQKFRWDTREELGRIPNITSASGATYGRIFVSPNGMFLAGVQFPLSGTIGVPGFLVDLYSFAPVDEFDGTLQGIRPTHVCWSLDSRFAAFTGTHGQKLVVWDTEESEWLPPIAIPVEFGHFVFAEFVSNQDIVAFTNKTGPGVLKIDVLTGGYQLPPEPVLIGTHRTGGNAPLVFNEESGEIAVVHELSEGYDATVLDATTLEVIKSTNLGAPNTVWCIAKIPKTLPDDS